MRIKQLWVDRFARMRAIREIAASVDPSWCIPKANPFHYDFYLRILGSDGLIVLDETRSSHSFTGICVNCSWVDFRTRLFCSSRGS